MAEGNLVTPGPPLDTISKGFRPWHQVTTSEKSPLQSLDSVTALSSRAGEEGCHPAESDWEQVIARVVVGDRGRLEGRKLWHQSVPQGLRPILPALRMKEGSSREHGASQVERLPWSLQRSLAQRTPSGVPPSQTCFGLLAPSP